MAVSTVPYVDFVRQYRPYEQQILAATKRVLGHGQFILGEEVEHLEQAAARYLGCREVIGVGSGTDALYLSMKALGIGAGDEVITTPNSYLASVSSICLTGAKPVLVDVGTDLNIDASQISVQLSAHTKAIIVVHLTGRPANMELIYDIAQQAGIPIIEDAAQSIGAEYSHKKIGTLGTTGCFSLHPLKNLGCIGDGGFIATNNQAIADYCRMARTHGHSSRDQCEFWSHNMRLDALQAAFVQELLPDIERIITQRRLHAQRYIERLSSMRSIELPPSEPSGMRAVFHTFVIKTDRRDALQQYLKEQGIDTKVHYPIPIHCLNSAKYLGYQLGDFPNAELFSQQILSLPIADYLLQEEIDYVCDKIIEWDRL